MKVNLEKSESCLVLNLDLNMIISSLLVSLTSYNHAARNVTKSVSLFMHSAPYVPFMSVSHSNIPKINHADSEVEIIRQPKK